MKSRRIELINTNYSKDILSTNKIIIDYTREYVKERKEDKQNLARINRVRLHKRMILLCKLVRMLERCKIKEFVNVEDKSCIQWNHQMPIVPKLTKKLVEIWKGYIE